MEITRSRPTYSRSSSGSESERKDEKKPSSPQPEEKRLPEVEQKPLRRRSSEILPKSSGRSARARKEAEGSRKARASALRAERESSHAISPAELRNYLMIVHGEDARDINDAELTRYAESVIAEFGPFAFSPEYLDDAGRTKRIGELYAKRARMKKEAEDASLPPELLQQAFASLFAILGDRLAEIPTPRCVAFIGRVCKDLGRGVFEGPPENIGEGARARMIVLFNETFGGELEAKKIDPAAAVARGDVEAMKTFCLEIGRHFGVERDELIRKAGGPGLVTACLDRHASASLRKKQNYLRILKMLLEAGFRCASHRDMKRIIATRDTQAIAAGLDAFRAVVQSDLIELQSKMNALPAEDLLDPIFSALRDLKKISRMPLATGELRKRTKALIESLQADAGAVVGLEKMLEVLAATGRTRSTLYRKLVRQTDSATMTKVLRTFEGGNAPADLRHSAKKLWRQDFKSRNLESSDVERDLEELIALFQAPAIADDRRAMDEVRKAITTRLHAYCEHVGSEIAGDPGRAEQLFGQAIGIFKKVHACSKGLGYLRAMDHLAAVMTHQLARVAILIAADIESHPEQASDTFDAAMNRFDGYVQYFVEPGAAKVVLQDAMASFLRRRATEAAVHWRQNPESGERVCAEFTSLCDNCQRLSSDGRKAAIRVFQEELTRQLRLCLDDAWTTFDADPARGRFMLDQAGSMLTKFWLYLDDESFRSTKDHFQNASERRFIGFTAGLADKIKAEPDRAQEIVVAATRVFVELSKSDWIAEGLQSKLK